MSCACEHKKLSSEYDRIRKLAKGLARIENHIVVVFANPDGSYSFCRDDAPECENRKIVEYITPY